MARIPILAIVASMILGACGGPVGEFDGDPLNQQSRAAGLCPVQLYFARASSRFEGQGGAALARLSGYLSIQNLAYHKEISVHYTSGNSGEWQDLEATYLRSLGDDREVWFFESPEVSYAPRLSADFQFAVRYRVAGREYWDNNQGNDYRISTGPRPRYPTDLILGKSLVALSNASYNCSWGLFRADIIVKNLAYQKQVELLTTSDGWRTVNTVAAGYFHPHQEDSELWSFQLPLNPDDCAPRIEFAVRYRVEGTEVWDNNFGSNYVFSDPISSR